MHWICVCKQLSFCDLSMSDEGSEYEVTLIAKRVDAECHFISLCELKEFPISRKLTVFPMKFNVDISKRAAVSGLFCSTLNS
jgi:hypothetical protein